MSVSEDAAEDDALALQHQIHQVRLICAWQGAATLSRKAFGGRAASWTDEVELRLIAPLVNNRALTCPGDSGEWLDTLRQAVDDAADVFVAAQRIPKGFDIELRRRLNRYASENLLLNLVASAKAAVREGAQAAVEHDYPASVGCHAPEALAASWRATGQALATWPAVWERLQSLLRGVGSRRRLLESGREVREQARRRRPLAWPVVSSDPWQSAFLDEVLKYTEEVERFLHIADASLIDDAVEVLAKWDQEIVKPLMEPVSGSPAVAVGAWYKSRKGAACVGATNGLYKGASKAKECLVGLLFDECEATDASPDAWRALRDWCESALALDSLEWLLPGATLPDDLDGCAIQRGDHDAVLQPRLRRRLRDGSYKVLREGSVRRVSQAQQLHDLLARLEASQLPSLERRIVHNLRRRAEKQAEGLVDDALLISFATNGVVRKLYWMLVQSSVSRSESQIRALFLDDLGSLAALCGFILRPTPRQANASFRAAFGTSAPLFQDDWSDSPPCRFQGVSIETRESGDSMAAAGWLAAPEGLNEKLVDELNEAALELFFYRDNCQQFWKQYKQFIGALSSTNRNPASWTSVLDVFTELYRQYRSENSFPAAAKYKSYAMALIRAAHKCLDALTSGQLWPHVDERLELERLIDIPQELNRLRITLQVTEAPPGTIVDAVWCVEPGDVDWIVSCGPKSDVAVLQTWLNLPAPPFPEYASPITAQLITWRNSLRSNAVAGRKQAVPFPSEALRDAGRDWFHSIASAAAEPMRRPDASAWLDALQKYGNVSCYPELKAGRPAWPPSDFGKQVTYRADSAPKGEVVGTVERFSVDKDTARCVVSLGRDCAAIEPAAELRRLSDDSTCLELATAAAALRERTIEHEFGNPLTLSAACSLLDPLLESFLAAAPKEEPHRSAFASSFLRAARAWADGWSLRILPEKIRSPFATEERELSAADRIHFYTVFNDDSQFGTVIISAWGWADAEKTLRHPAGCISVGKSPPAYPPFIRMLELAGDSLREVLERARKFPQVLLSQDETRLERWCCDLVEETFDAGRSSSPQIREIQEQLIKLLQAFRFDFRSPSQRELDGNPDDLIGYDEQGSALPRPGRILKKVRRPALWRDGRRLLKAEVVT